MEIKKVKLLSMHIQNFKGCKDRTIEFGERTRISGANATGKTTIFDSFKWLLFGKDSLGNSDFDVRPLDKDGKTIDNIEISVEAKISVDGEEYDLKKVQKQKWVKKRGTGITEFQGNVNEFEINGYPKSQKEFKEFIAGIIDEEIFTLITDPAAFNALPWKKQREILMKFVGAFPDAEIAQTFGDKYAKLVPELKIASTDDILKKYNRAKAALNKDMDEIPARIDEVSKQLVIADVGALEVEKSAKEVALQKVEDEISGGSGKLEEINSKREEVMNLKFHLSEIQNAENQELLYESTDIRNDLSRKQDALNDLKHDVLNKESEIRDAHVKYEDREREKNRLLVEWKSEKVKAYPALTPLEPLTDDSFICPTCGQDLPEEVKQKRIADYEARKTAYESKYEKDKAEFEENRAKRLSQIEADGKAVAKSRDEFKALEESLIKEKDELNVKLADAQREYEIKPVTTDVSRTILARYYKGCSNIHENSGIAIPILTPDRAEKRQNGRRFKDDGEPMFTLTGQDRHGVATSVPVSMTRNIVEEEIENTLDTSCNQGIFVQVSEELVVYAVWYERYQCYIAIRKLTPKECFRLQGWTDDYFEKAQFVNSDSQLYKQAGNGVTVNVIEAIAEKLRFA